MTSAAPPAGALPAGTCVAGAYRVDGVLGQGGMGTVYRARDLRSGEAVALKLLHAHLLRDRQVSERFHREASILRRLRGRHLVRLLDFGQDDAGQLYMALELVEGEPLDRLVRARGPLPPNEAAQLLGGVCDALASAHAHGVVHRDLTPANVMVGRDELGRPHVRVFDFGLAKALHDASGPSVALTHHNMIFGTAEYMAPEQVRGEDLDGRADVYAAGAILYELLTGAPPFRGANDVVTMTAHLTEPPEPPSRRLGRAGVVSPLLDEVVLRALAKAREDRFASANELREAVFRALRPEHAATPPAGSPARPPTPPAGSPARPPTPPAGSPGRTSARPPTPPGGSPERTPLPSQPRPMLGSETLLAAPVVVPPPASQGAVDPFTTTMTLQPPAAPAEPRPPSPSYTPAPGPITPDSLPSPAGFGAMVWVSVALVAVVLGVAVGVGLSMMR